MAQSFHFVTGKVGAVTEAAAERHFRTGQKTLPTQEVQKTQVVLTYKAVVTGDSASSSRKGWQVQAPIFPQKHRSTALKTVPASSHSKAQPQSQAPQKVPPLRKGRCPQGPAALPSFEGCVVEPKAALSSPRGPRLSSIPSSAQGRRGGEMDKGACASDDLHLILDGRRGLTSENPSDF